MTEVINIKKKNLYFGLLVFLILLLLLVTSIILKPKTVISKEIDQQEITRLEAKFSILSEANTNSCGGTFSYVDSMSDGERIQGSCCGKMNFHRYTEQLEGLEKYSKYDIIPSDPYDVSVSTAKKLLSYQKDIILSEDEQTIYDEAVELSHEGGPCCCKCWHWYAYEGLAKYLIVEEGFSVEQVAEIWDISDACGGSGHIENIGEHG